MGKENPVSMFSSLPPCVDPLHPPPHAGGWGRSCGLQREGVGWIPRGERDVWVPPSPLCENSALFRTTFGFVAATFGTTEFGGR